MASKGSFARERRNTPMAQEPAKPETNAAPTIISTVAPPTLLAAVGGFFGGFPYAVGEIAKRTNEPVVLICSLGALLALGVTVVIAAIWILGRKRL